jgi:hypothetical protein
MRNASIAMAAAVGLIVSAASFSVVRAADQDTAKPATTGSTKPHLGNGPAEEKSLPSSAPPATTGQTTGKTNQSGGVKAMNEDAKAKVDVEGK